jgi:hypothetical protein
MIEAYAFLAMFGVQIMAMSVLLPAGIVKDIRRKAAEFPVERFAEMYPDVDHHRSLERYVSRFRLLNKLIALLGLILMSWLFT